MATESGVREQPLGLEETVPMTRCEACDVFLWVGMVLVDPHSICNLNFVNQFTQEDGP